MISILPLSGMLNQYITISVKKRQRVNGSLKRISTEFYMLLTDFHFKERFTVRSTQLVKFFPTLRNYLMLKYSSMFTYSL